MFEEKNHLKNFQPDKILDKPGQITNLQQMKDSKPLAGRFSEIGQQILAVGNKKASYICTGHWNEISPVEEPKKVKPITVSPT